MRTISTSADLTAALTASPGTVVDQLLASRWHDLLAGGAADLAQLARFIVVEPGDELSQLEEALGFSPLVNLIDGATLGEPEFTPSWEWVLDHRGLFEAPFILSDDGFGWILLVLDQPGVEPALLELLRAHAQPA